jgi:hypothetical protein
MLRRAATVAALVAALAAAPAARASATVVTGGVRGGEVTGFAWDPTTSGTVYAAVHGAGLFKSLNGGVKWQQILLPTIAAHFVNAVLATKAAANVVLVCDVAPSQAAIWRSGDGGGNFASVVPSTTGSCTAITDGTSAGTLYAGIQDNANAGHLLKSPDGGKTWGATALNLPGVLVSAVVQLPAGRLVIGLRDGAGGLRGKNNTGAVYYSDDDGAHWTMATGAGSAAVAGIAFNGTNTLVALTTNGTTASLFTSADGITWTAGATAAASDQGGQVSYHAASDTFFLMATNDKLVRSANGAGGYAFGATDIAATAAAPVPLSLNHHLAFAVDPADATHVLLGDAGGGEGIFATADGGGVWVVSNDGLFAQQIDLALESPGKRRYAANRTGFVYAAGSTVDAAWTRVYRAKDVTRDPVSALAYDTADDKRLFVAQSNLVDQAALLLLPDVTAAGDDAPPFSHTAWSTLAYPDNGKAPIFGLLVDGMTILAGVAHSQSATAGQYLYRSTNGGTSWALTSLNVVGGVRALAFDPSKHTTIFAGAGDYKGDLHTVAHAGGLWKSTDGGDNWTRVSTTNATLDGESPRTIVVDPLNGARVWAFCDKPNSTSGTDGDIFESLDAGASWTTITPSNGVFAFTYSAAEGLLAYATGGANVNVYVKLPGNGSSLWSPGFGVYGEASVLYAGSIGVGTGTGLFEASGVMLGTDDMNFFPIDDLGPPIDFVDMGPGTMPSHGGCGCDVASSTGAAAWGLALAVVFARLLFRRRGARARPRA